MNPQGEGRLKPASLVFAAAAVLIGAYYLWGVQAAGYGFVWKGNLDGYYDHLARGFAGGHLYLPDQPAPELLRLPNPWDPRVDDSLKMFDAVLFHRRYYLYHGAGPAVMLFAPWRMITHRDLPENFALFLFCFGGFLFSGGALLGALRLLEVQIRPLLLAFLLVLAGTCQGVPFLLNRVWVYEVAIGAGYFCVSGGFYCYVRSVLSGSGRWMAGSGLLFGLAISCRPHLGLAGAIACVAIVCSGRMGRSRLVAFTIPFVAAGLGVATYNYQRFGNPVDFGNRYLLGGANQTAVNLSTANVVPGMYYLLGSAPEFSPVFPWVRLPLPPHEFPRPATYTVEPTVGAIYLAPFVPLAFLPSGFLMLFMRNRLRALRWTLLASGSAVLLFLSATGWSTQRYQVDFLPPFVLCALVMSAVVVQGRGYLIPVLGVLAGFGIITNLALGISGPLDEMLKNRPARFVRIAGWFSPLERFRPALNPSIDVQVRAHPIKLGSFRQSLFVAGRMPYKYELYLERVGDRNTLVSSYAGIQMSRELAGTARDLNYRIRFVPSSGEVSVRSDTAELLSQKVRVWVTAPSDIVCGSEVLECDINRSIHVH